MKVHKDNLESSLPCPLKNLSKSELLPPKNPKNQNSENQKILLKISSLYTYVPKITII